MPNIPGSHHHHGKLHHHHHNDNALLKAWGENEEQEDDRHHNNNLRMETLESPDKVCSVFILIIYRTYYLETIRKRRRETRKRRSLRMSLKVALIISMKKCSALFVSINCAQRMK